MTSNDPTKRAQTPGREKAVEIYQSFLDETSRAIMHGDPEIFCHRVLLPFVMRTAQDETVLESWEDLVEDTRRVIKSLHQMHVTDFIRIALRARFVSPDTIEGWHRTYILRGANTVTPPYESRIVLRRTDAEWKVMLSEHEVSSHGGLPLSYLQGLPGSLAEKWRDGPGEAAVYQIDAGPIYDVFLASLDRANAENDFEAWSQHFLFPLAWHLSDSDRIIENAQELRRLFFEIQNKLVIAGRPTRIHRSPKTAGFLMDGRILGYHDLEWRDGADVLFGPVTSRVMLRTDGGRLAAEDISNNLEAAFFDEGTPARTATLPTFREIERRSQARKHTENKDDKT